MKCGRDTVLRLAVAWVLGAACCSLSIAEGFDKPLMERAADPGSSKSLTGNKQQGPRICSYYEHFMINQVNDPVHQGAFSLVVVPVPAGHMPACTQRPEPGQHVLKPMLRGEASFAGVKRNVVFFTASDSTSGGVSFQAFDALTGEDLFQDSALPGKSPGTASLDFVHASDSAIVLRYVRVYAADCSVRKERMSCWQRIVRQTGLERAPMPAACVDSTDPDTGAPSVIGYRVQVRFSPKPTVKVLSNPRQCWHSAPL
jgi:hypothetical protein